MTKITVKPGISSQSIYTIKKFRFLTGLHLKVAKDLFDQMKAEGSVELEPDPILTSRDVTHQVNSLVDLGCIVEFDGMLLDGSSTSRCSFLVELKGLVDQAEEQFGTLDSIYLSLRNLYLDQRGKLGR